MEKERLIEKAVTLKQQGGCNCCQAVAGALAEETELSPEILRQLAAGFGMGMGNMEGVCGALSGAVLIAGLKTHGQGTTRAARQISERFRDLSGSVICRSLKGKANDGVFCSCDDCVRNAVQAYCEVFPA